MRQTVKFSYEQISTEEIKDSYFLNVFAYRDAVQTENIAYAIQSLYFFHDLIIVNELPKPIVANLCRTFVILSYSVIEAIVIAAGHKLQAACFGCDLNPHQPRCTVLKNEKNAYFAADSFLKKHGILNLSKSSSQFYNDFRDARNDVHIIKSRLVLNQNSKYTQDYCKLAVFFLQEFVVVLKDNYLEFTRVNQCRTNL